jgi:hypothetical protein
MDKPDVTYEELIAAIDFMANETVSSINQTQTNMDTINKALARLDTVEPPRIKIGRLLMPKKQKRPTIFDNDLKED